MLESLDSYNIFILWLVDVSYAGPHTGLEQDFCEFVSK